MFKNLRRGRQARNFKTKVPKILDLKASSEQMFSESWRWVTLGLIGIGCLLTCLRGFMHKIANFFTTPFSRNFQQRIVHKKTKPNKEMTRKPQSHFGIEIYRNLIEDEVHFLFQCPTYSMIRNKFYYKVKTLIPNITQLPINGLINELMNSSNYFINIQFIKYISACFDVLDKLLSK